MNYFSGVSHFWRSVYVTQKPNFDLKIDSEFEKKNGRFYKVVH